MKSKLTTFIIVIVLVIGLGLWGYWYFGNSASTNSATNTSEADTNTISSNDPFFALLAGLDQIDLKNQQLLSDPVFQNKLIDLREPVQDRGRGRSNPFGLLGSGNYDAGDLPGAMGALPIFTQPESTSSQTLKLAPAKKAIEFTPATNGTNSVDKLLDSLGD